MEPAEKSPQVENILDSILGRQNARRDAIIHHRCVPTPVGCGRTIPDEEFDTWDLSDFNEYKISGLCADCQRLIFGDND